MQESPRPNRQIILFAAAAAVICAVLLVIYFMAFRTNYVVLLSELRPTDASAVVAELDKRKVPYRLTEKGTTILVPENVADENRLNIMSSELPLKGAVGFELFNKSDMGLTEFAQKINYQRALQGELARTIMTLNGVDSARVHLSLAEKTIFQRDQATAKASVTVTPHMGIMMSSGQIAGIQHLVASAVPDLESGNVVVLDARGDVVSSTQSSSESATMPALQQKQAIEQYYAGKVREALQSLPSGHDSDVTVFALRDAFATVPADANPIGNSTNQSATKHGADDLSPEQRTFGLRVTLTPKSSINAGDQKHLIETARKSIGFDVIKGDEVSIGVAHVTAPVVVPAAQNGDAAPTTQQANDWTPASHQNMSWLWGLAGFGLAALVTGLIWWTRKTLPLSEARRDQLSAQLAHLLDRHEGEEQHVG